LKAHDPHALDSVVLPLDVPVVTVCNSGYTSRIASKQLQARGIEAHSLEGGMQAWSLAWNTADVPLPSNSTEVIQVRRVGKGCLSYLIGSQGEAAVIDAALPPEVYLNLAKSRGWSITAVLDTHIHADQHDDKYSQLRVSTFQYSLHEGTASAMPGFAKSIKTMRRDIELA
jgi:hypothetical protein